MLGVAGDDELLLLGWAEKKELNERMMSEPPIQHPSSLDSFVLFLAGVW